jgi:outer membrane protein assembly factor BamB
MCLDRASGEKIWQKTAARLVPHEGHHDTNTYASASAVTDGQHVYASFGSRGLYCYDIQGNLVWERDLGDMETRLGFGEGSTPTLHGDTLVVNWDHEGQSFIVALDAKSGETRWQKERDEQTTWATPLVIDRGGRTQVVTNGENRVRSYDLTSGDLLWECGGQAANPIPSPVQLNDLVICVTGYRGYAAYAIPLDSSGDLTGTDKIAWSMDDHTPYISSPLLYEGKLYLTKGRNAIASCVDAATGEVHYSEQRLPETGTMYASPVGAAGRVYFTNREGTTTVIEHGPEFKVLSINKLDEGIDASPAIVGDTMYIRGEKHLYAITESP